VRPSEVVEHDHVGEHVVHVVGVRRVVRTRPVVGRRGVVVEL